jgi:hypothetical protein
VDFATCTTVSAHSDQPADAFSLGRSTATGSCPCSRSSDETRCQSHEVLPPPWMSANVDTERVPRRRSGLRLADAGRGRLGTTSTCPVLALMTSSIPPVPRKSAVSMNTCGGREPLESVNRVLEVVDGWVPRSGHVLAFDFVEITGESIGIAVACLAAVGAWIQARTAGRQARAESQVDAAQKQVALLERQLAAEDADRTALAKHG